jgi:photosystem II stability/assembly factor-like uncharacterized protein
MKNCILVLLVFFFYTSLLFLQTIEWQQLNGPFGGTALCFASNSNGDLFAGADQNQRGVFKSTDDGITWIPKSNGIALADRAISWITVDDSDYVIIGTGSHIGNRVYKSTDAGDSWFETENMGGTSVAKNDSGHIYVGNTGYGQYSVSKDAGYTWTHFSHPSPFINCIEINDSGHIFIGGNYTAYRSTDNGATWTALSGGITSGIQSIAFNDSGHIFVGNWQEYASQSGILKSTDNGDTWTTVKLGFRVNSSHNIVINTNGDIIVGTWGWGIWKSTDNGTTWNQYNSSLGHLYIKSMHVTDSGDLYAGLSGGGIYRSTDNGENWTQVGLTVASVKKIVINPTNDYMFASVSGISRSTDNGQSWQTINNGLSNLDVKEVTIKNDGTIFLGCGSNIPYTFRSTDNGNSWTAIENGIQRHDVEAIAIDTAGNIYAGNYYGVYKSTDNGDNWVNIGGVAGAKELCFNSIGDLFLASWGQGFWKLPAGDTTWINLTTIINSSWNWSMLIASNDYIYVGSKRSTDNGITWEEITYPGPYICYAENSVGNIFIGTRSYGTGIWRSTDFGESWEATNTGLSTLEIWSLAIDSEDYLYAGTDGKSMFKTTTSTVTSVENEKRLPSTFYLEQNYPNPFNPSTKISWQSPVGSHQVLKVFDVLGNEVATLVNEYKPAGMHNIQFTINNLASGIYFYQLKAGSYIQTKKMILVK